MNQHSQSTPTSPSISGPKADLLKCGIDIHKREYVVVAQWDAQSPKCARKFAPEAFLGWVAEQRACARRIVTCYEAGCFGYVLHRRLAALGIENLVVRPRNWDEYGSKVKTDARDARELCSHLDRYLAGNERALSVVRVPTEAQEQARSLSRQRETLAKELKRLQNVGISNARYYGHELKTTWWKALNFKRLLESLPAYLLEVLEPFQAILASIDAQLREVTAREQRSANRELPIGLGALTTSVLDREFRDYHRFGNRREVASYTGLCPGEASSGNTRRQGSINKHGNPRIRHNLIEATWRLLQFQPDYEPIKHWKERIAREPFGAAKKKKMIVAIARRFAVDWWRINTGQIEPEAVGLRTAYPTDYATAALRAGRISKVYAKTVR